MHILEIASQCLAVTYQFVHLLIDFLTEIFCNNYTPDTCLKVGLKGITGISNSWYNKAVQCSMQEHNIYNKKRNIIRSSQEKTNQLKLNLKHYPNRSNCRHTFFRVVLKNPQNLQGVI